jgi:hypothetical protein
MRAKRQFQTITLRAFSINAQSKPLPEYEHGKPDKSSSSSMPTIPNLQKLRRFYKKADVIEHPLSDKVEKLQATEKITLNNLSMSHDTYWAVTLDGRVTKTLFKDDLLIPSKSLAIALAEEWES